MRLIETENYLTGIYRKPPYVGGICPRCRGQMPQGYPGATSRRDNETEICSPCGVAEAVQDWERATARHFERVTAGGPE